MIQVFSFQTFRKRVFLMAPIHHHFELLGWSETKIILRFWIIAAICSAIGFTLYQQSRRVSRARRCRRARGSSSGWRARASRRRGRCWRAGEQVVGGRRRASPEVPDGRRGALRHRRAGRPARTRARS